MIKQLGLSASAFVLLFANTASAHLTITSHDSRNGDQKVGPCEGARRGSKVYTYEPGETITVSWSEDIPHPGWFRISFDADGEDDFEPPATVEPKDLYTNDAVLADDLFPHDSAGFGEARSTEVTLPDVECDNCTMQIIQIMLDKPPYDPSVSSPLTGDIYYRCVDMVLKRSGTTTPDPTTDAGMMVDPGTQTDAGTMMPNDAGTNTPMDDGQTPAPMDPADMNVSNPPPAMNTGGQSTNPPPNNMTPPTGTTQNPISMATPQPMPTAGQGATFTPTTTTEDSGCAVSRPAASAGSTALGAMLVSAALLSVRRRRRA